MRVTTIINSYTRYNHGLYLESNTNTHIQIARNSMVFYFEIVVMISYMRRSIKPDQMAEKLAILFGVVVSKFDLKDHAWRWCS